MAQVFPPPAALYFDSPFLLLSLPSPSPQRRSAGGVSPGCPPHARHRWGCLPPSSILSCPTALLLSSCRWAGVARVEVRRGNPKCRGSADGGFSSASWQGRARSCCCEGGTAPCRQCLTDCIWQAEAFQRQRVGAFWVGRDAECCREIGDEHLTLINAFYCQTSHKPHKSL